MKEPPGKTPAERLAQPFLRFLHTAASGGILLLIGAVLALAWANGPWGDSYVEVWKKTFLSFEFAGISIRHPLYWWINDALMVIFFFVVGLEIKREVLLGELSSARQAALPIAAAIGGMLVPASLYALLNQGGTGESGWGVPMATDIAFAVGILSLLGRRVPLALKVFLLALAIADDIGAVLVIAIFYTGDIAREGLLVIVAAFGYMVLLNRLHVRSPILYLAGGLVMWFGFVKSGIHPTAGGVLAAIAIPARQRIDIDDFLSISKDALGELEEDRNRGSDVLPSRIQRQALSRLDRATDQVELPIRRLEGALHPWVSYLIMPLFAFANAGVRIEAGLGAVFSHPVTLGIVLGLVVGKPVGIFLLSWIAVRLRLARLPSGVTWRSIIGAGCLAGIGFTMSIFIASLAFGGEQELLDKAKIAILAASLVSGLLGAGAILVSAGGAGGSRSSG
ncbi:MAG: Na+/H+ antiporter NhaA [Candidatus Eisenbacteria bacterium]|nr:Na+/H+ antiporter NhaA [Candidatus Latescibacterota bacterium]MBD3302283.1 Na+/H+ antiporter NhaA [Candidatus Eisenbacteria bacterium]